MAAPNDSPPAASASQNEARPSPSPADTDVGRGTFSAGAETARDESFRVLVSGRPVRLSSIGRASADLRACPIWTGGRPAAETLALMVGGTVEVATGTDGRAVRL